MLVWLLVYAGVAAGAYELLKDHVKRIQMRRQYKRQSAIVMVNFVLACVWPLTGCTVAYVKARSWLDRRENRRGERI